MNKKVVFSSILMGLLLSACNNNHKISAQQKETKQEEEQKQNPPTETITVDGSTVDTTTDTTRPELNFILRDSDYKCQVPKTPVTVYDDPVCKAPSDPEAIKMDDGYFCFDNNDCKSGVCNEIYTCGAIEDALEEESNLPLYAICTGRNKDCLTGACRWTNQKAYCMLPCMKGDKGDGVYACIEELFPQYNEYSAIRKHYCMSDPKIGHNCCTNSDCGDFGICYAEHCTIRCDEGFATCLTGSTCNPIYSDIGLISLCIDDKLIGTLANGSYCDSDIFCASGHCANHACQDLSGVNCSGPKNYPDYSQPNGYPCNLDQDCASNICNISENQYLCDSSAAGEIIPAEVTGLPDNAPCQFDEQCESGYCWYNGGTMFDIGISDASYCARPCDPKFAGSDGKFACQKNNFNKFICSPVRGTNRGSKNSPCQITEFDCNEGLTCDRADYVCKGL